MGLVSCSGRDRARRPRRVSSPPVEPRCPRLNGFLNQPLNRSFFEPRPVEPPPPPPVVVPRLGLSPRVFFESRGLNSRPSPGTRRPLPFDLPFGLEPPAPGAFRPRPPPGTRGARRVFGRSPGLPGVLLSPISRPKPGRRDAKGARPDFPPPGTRELPAGPLCPLRRFLARSRIPGIPPRSFDDRPRPGPRPLDGAPFRLEPGDADPAAAARCFLFDRNSADSANAIAATTKAIKAAIADATPVANVAT